MAPSSSNFPSGALAVALLFVLAQICICQQRDIRPKPSHSPPSKPTMPSHYHPTRASTSRDIHHPSSAAPDLNFRTRDAPRIRPSPSREPTFRSRDLRSSVTSGGQPKKQSLSQPGRATVNIRPSPSREPTFRSRDLRSSVTSGGQPKKQGPAQPSRATVNIRPSPSREPTFRSRDLRSSVTSGGQPKKQGPAQPGRTTVNIRPSPSREPTFRSRDLRSSVTIGGQPKKQGPPPSPRTTAQNAGCKGGQYYCSHTRQCILKGEKCSPIKPTTGSNHGSGNCPKGSSCTTTKQPSPSPSKKASKCLMFQPDKPIKETIPLRGFVAIILGSSYKGIWKYSLGYNVWKEVRCRPGQAIVLSVMNLIRFEPHDGFHGAVKFGSVEFRGSARTGSCVTFTTKPSAQYSVASIILPKFVPFTVSRAVDKVQLREDQVDKTGKQLSELFNVTNKRILAADNSSLECIPSDVRARYLAHIKEFNTNSRPAVAMIQAPDFRKGSVEYRYTKSDRWRRISSGTASIMSPYPLPLHAFVRLSLVPNANGKTSIKLVAAALVPRGEPLGFNDLKTCARDFLKEIEQLNYVYSTLLDVVYKAFQQTKEKGTVTVDGLISTLKQQERMADRHLLEHIRRAQDILRQVKDVCDGKMKKTAFYRWYNNTVASRVKKTPCEMIRGSSRCFFSRQMINLPVDISSVDDRPIINEPRIYYPPVPSSLDSTYQMGFPVFMLLQADQKVVEKLIFDKKSDKLRETMAKGSRPDSLVNHLSKKEQRIVQYHDRKCAKDYDGDDLGMAILNSSPSIRNEILGRWQLQTQGSSSWVPLKKPFRELKQDRGSCTPVVLVKPGDRLRFEPNSSFPNWNNAHAQEFTRLDFRAWESKDNRTSGGHCVEFNTSGTTFSEGTSSMIVTRLGCNGMPGSMSKPDLCGVCGGDNKCAGCDGVPNSGAKKECNICYGGTTGVKRPKRDCANSTARCNSSYIDECGKCQSYHSLKKNFKDCAGICMGARGYGARINECKLCVGGVTGLAFNAGMDACGECGGDNSTCSDCKGILKGPHKTDECNKCLRPDSPDFNKCVKITTVDPVTFPASSSYINVKATGVKTARTASCVLQKDSARVTLQKASVRAASRDGVSSFFLVIKNVAPGSYSLGCKFDSFQTEVEFTKQKLLIYSDTSLKISSVKPNFALQNKAVNVTILGSGFIDSKTTRCVLEKKLSRFTIYFVIKAKYISSSRVMCFIPPVGQTGDFKLGVAFSRSLTGMKKAPFSIMAIAPRPYMCKLSDNTKELTITFDQPAYFKSRSIRCQDLFVESSAKMLGTRPKCYFRNKRLTMKLPPDAPFIKSGRTLTLLYRRTKNAFGKLTHYRDGVSEVAVNCSRPTKRKPVTVEIRGAKTAGPCQKFKFEVKASGSGRLKYAWSASFSNESGIISASHAADMRKLNEFLSKMKKKSLTILKNYVLANAKYKLQVKVTDVVGEQGRAVFTLSRDESEAPRVAVAGPKIRKVPANRAFKLRATTTFSLCHKRSFQDLTVLYMWSSSNVELQKFNLRKLTVKKLRPRKEYIFNVTACAKGLSQCSKASVTVITESRPLECKIKEGKIRSIGENDRLKLDGRGSKDPDADPEDMKYSWLCEDPDGYTCYYPNKANPDELVRLNIPDEPLVQIDAAEQLPKKNRTYKFSLTVSKGNRSCTSEVKIKVQKGSPLAKTKMFETKKADSNKKIVVRGQIESDAPVTEFKFSIVEENKEDFAFVDLEEDGDVVSSKTKGEVERTDPKKPARKNLHLVINPGKLAENAKYKIKLTATYDNVTSYAETILETKAQPTQGEMLVEPPEGVAANTSFTLRAGDGWSVAEDLGPLTYACGCYLKDRRGDIKPKYFVEFSENDFCETQLPPGDKNNNHTLTCFIEACDVEGSCSKTEHDVIVTPKKIQADDVAKAKEQVLESFAQGDLSAATSAITSFLLSKKNDDVSSEEDEKEDDEVKAAMEKFIKTAIDKVLDANENGETQSEDEKNLVRNGLTLTVEDATEETLKTEISKRISDNLYEMERAKEKEDEETSSRRKRRSVDNGKNPDVEEKTVEQVESTLNIYRKIIQPANFSNDSMTVKEQFLDLLDELGRSMCKGLTTGEAPVEAETNVTVLRSEKNSFEHVHTNYSLIGCNNCTLYGSRIARVLLGKTLKDLYDNWDCVEDGCNGACVVSSQMSHDLLVTSLAENKSRVSDVIYVNLFNPETLVPLTIHKLATPVTFVIPLVNFTAAHSSDTKCHKWDEPSSSWTTTEVSTNPAVVNGNEASVTCTSGHLGFFTVFDLSPKDSQSSTTTPPTDQTSTSSSDSSSTNAKTASQTEGPSVTSNNDQKMEIQFSLDASYYDVINTNNKGSFIDLLRDNIAAKLGVQKSRISNVSVRPGSIIVNFVLLPSGNGQQSVQNLTETFRDLVQSGSFVVTLSNGQRLNVISSSFLQGSNIPTSNSFSPQPPTSVENTETVKASGGLSQGTLIGIIVVASFIVLAAIIGLVFCCLRAKDKNQKVRAMEEEEEEYLAISKRNKKFEKDIPMQGIHNKGHMIKEAPMVKGSAGDNLPSLPGTPNYDND